MPPNEIEVPLSTAKAVAAVDDLQRRLNQLISTAKELGNAIEKGTATPTQLSQFNTVTTAIAGVSGSISALQTSATVGGSANSPNVAAAGARGGIRGFQQGMTVGGDPISPSSIPSLALQQALAAGSAVDASRIVATSIPALSAQIVRQASAAAGPPSAPQPMGPYSPIGPPGYNANRYYFDQQQTAARNRMMYLGALGYGGATAVSGGMSLYSSNTVSGDLDVMGAAALYGGTMGMFGGAQAGWSLGMLSPVPEPGLGAIVGAGLGRDLGAAAMQAYMAPHLRRKQGALALTSFAARSGLTPSEMMKGGIAGEPLEAMADRITFRGKDPWTAWSIKMGLYTGTDITSVKDLSEMTATLGSAYLAAGENPRGLAMNTAGRAAERFGLGAPRMAQMTAQVLAARNRLGNNPADLALRFGAEAYGAYSDILGESDPLSPRELTAIRNTQRLGYRGELESYRIRGSGAAMTRTYREEMVEIARLPGGRESLAYAESRGRMRDARDTMFRQEDIDNYGVRAAELSGVRDVLSAMPYSPGNRMRLAGGIIRNEQSQIRRLNARLNQLRGEGELSAEQELELTSQIWHHRGAMAREVGALSDGAIDRIPALSVGRIQGMSRWDNLSMASLMNPWFRRDFGHMGGRRARVANDFMQDVLGDFSEPYSKTRGLNMSGVEARLDRLIQIIEKAYQQGGGFHRMREPGGWDSAGEPRY